MKIVTILSLLLLASPVVWRTDQRGPTHHRQGRERRVGKAYVKEYIDLKIDALDQKLSAKIDGVEKDLNTRIDAVEKSLGRVWLMIAALIGLITATIAIPQIIIAYRDRGQKEMESSQQAMQTQIDQLRAQIEAMQNSPS